MKLIRSLLPYVLICMILFFICACKSPSSAEYTVDASSCNGCGECIRICPYDAIFYDSNNNAVIDQTKCQKCGKCVPVCPNSAIY